MSPTSSKQGYGGSALSGTILVIDDVRPVREMLQQLLEREGLEVILADCGHAALQLFEHKHDEITAVILDHTMPGLSGHEVCARLRALRPDIPVLFSSGHPEDFVGQADLRSGPVGFLKKPYTRAELLSTLNELMEAASDGRQTLEV
jgi:CheY-like chemotaxis protein